MSSTVNTLALVFAVVGFFFLWSAFRALRRGRLIRLTTRTLTAMVLLAGATLFGAFAIGTHGYRALTREEVAAIVETEPLAEHRFRARFRFNDGRVAVYDIAGDELYVDAHILKWKPLANVFGLHTAYELDRVAGRYQLLANEQQALRTVYGLGQRRPIDMFTLRQRYALLAPLVDAEYGSGTFVTVDRPERLEVRVSTSGLLIRRLPQSSSSSK